MHRPPYRVSPALLPLRSPLPLPALASGPQPPSKLPVPRSRKPAPRRSEVASFPYAQSLFSLLVRAASVAALLKFANYCVAPEAARHGKCRPLKWAFGNARVGRTLLSAAFDFE